VVDEGRRNDEYPARAWVEIPGEAIAFYEAAFGATVLSPFGEEDDVVAQLGVGDGAFWVAARPRP